MSIQGNTTDVPYPEQFEKRPYLSKLPGSSGAWLAYLFSELDRRKEVKRFSKFAIVGAIGFVIDFGLSNLLWTVLPRDLIVALPFNVSMSYIGLGGLVGFFAAVTSNFIWNRYWTYPDSRSKSLAGQLALFFAINIIGALIRVPILEYAAQPLADLVSNLAGTVISAELAIRLGKNLALMIAVFVVMLWNFFVNRYITYNDVD